LLEQQAVPLAAAVGECDIAPLYLDFAKRMVEAQAALAAEDTPRVLLAGRRLMEGQLARHPHAVLLAALCLVGCLLVCLSLALHNAEIRMLLRRAASPAAPRC
jgi:hypothetical protein